MMTMVRRFNVLFLILFISFCSTAVSEEPVIENTTLTSTTFVDVDQDEELATW